MVYESKIISYIKNTDIKTTFNVNTPSGIIALLNEALEALKKEKECYIQIKEIGIFSTLSALMFDDIQLLSAWIIKAWTELRDKNISIHYDAENNKYTL